MARRARLNIPHVVPPDAALLVICDGISNGVEELTVQRNIDNLHEEAEAVLPIWGLWWRYGVEI